MNVLCYFEATASRYLYQENKITLLLHFHDGIPVSTVELFPTDNHTIGIYGLATQAEYRGMGIGSSMMTFALNLAKESGYRQVVLQASREGLGIYRKLGFKDLTTYFEFGYENVRNCFWKSKRQWINKNGFKSQT